jgi:hypothetical protein
MELIFMELINKSATCELLKQKILIQWTTFFVTFFRHWYKSGPEPYEEKLYLI